MIDSFTMKTKKLYICSQVGGSGWNRCALGVPTQGRNRKEGRQSVEVTEIIFTNFLFVIRYWGVNHFLLFPFLPGSASGTRWYWLVIRHPGLSPGWCLPAGCLNKAPSSEYVRLFGTTGLCHNFKILLLWYKGNWRQDRWSFLCRGSVSMDWFNQLWIGSLF